MITTCNSHVTITRIRTVSLTCVMAFSTMPTDAESYFGGTSSIARTPKSSFNSLITTSRNANVAGALSDLTINSGYPSLFNNSTVSLVAVWSSTPLHWTNMLQIIILGLTFTTRNGVAALGVLTVVSVNEEPVIHACNKQTVLLFMPSFVNVRPPRATNANAAPIAIRIMTTCFVGSNLLIRWLQWLDFWFGGARLSYVIITKKCPSWSRLLLSHWMVPALVHVSPTNLCPATQLDEFFVVQSTSVWLNEKCWNAEAPCSMKNATYPSSSLMLSSWNTTRSLCFCECLQTRLSSNDRSPSNSRSELSFHPFSLDGRLLTFISLSVHTTLVYSFNLSHYLSTAACNWFSFLALGWSCPNFKTCTVWPGCFLEFSKVFNWPTCFLQEVLHVRSGIL